MSGTFRSLFFGTPEFSVPALDALAALSTVAAVVCQPDKAVGRGLKIAAPATKTRALELGLSVLQPAKVRTPEFAAWVREQRADVAVVIAYGRILPQEVLDGPRLGCVNLHASILPKYRGAAPITWAVVRGETETGITLMKMDAGMDTGAMLETWTAAIGPEETAGELSPRLAELAARAVREGVPRFVRGELGATPQDGALATMAPMLDKQAGRIDWSLGAKAVHDHVRGMNPWPMAWTEAPAAPPAAAKRIIVHRTRPIDATSPRSSSAPAPVPGEVVLADKTRVWIACGTGMVEALRVQLEGKKPVTGAEWFLGRGVREGDVLGGASQLR